jgi:glycerophosphoryl diester phosphodiesterase
MRAFDLVFGRPIAHRGLHDRAAGVIENSLSAFAAARARGYAIECDVVLSGDGEAMVFHDRDLRRLAGRPGVVGEMRASELSAITLAGSADAIPTLPRMLDAVAGDAPLVIEIKSGFRGDLRLTRRVIEIMGAYAGPFVLKSFDPRIVAALRVLAPEMPRGVVGMSDFGEDPEIAHLDRNERKALQEMLHFAETEPDFVSWHVHDLPTAAPYFARVHLGRPLMVWTVRTPEARAIAAAHADQIVFEGFAP